jgi:hypothetical protein
VAKSLAEEGRPDWPLDLQLAGLPLKASRIAREAAEAVQRPGGRRAADRGLEGPFWGHTGMPEVASGRLAATSESGKDQIYTHSGAAN